MLYGLLNLFKNPWMAATYDTHQIFMAYGCFKYEYIEIKNKIQNLIEI
jgi:hypothetical protein